MRFLHMADVHLGCVPDGKKEWAVERSREIWETFRATLEDAVRLKVQLVLIAGDLFHTPPDEEKLRELNYLCASCPEICFAIIAGNHDCMNGSAWKSFAFHRNVAFIPESSCECLRFPSLGCEVYGLSYEEPRIREALYDKIRPEKNDYFHILLAHGGDRDHIPIDVKKLKASGFDYIALGHIHKRTDLIPNKALYPGALSPIDAGDEGPHGYLLCENSGRSVHTKFVVKAVREYVTMNLSINEKDTVFSAADKVREAIRQRGEENLYKVILRGARSPGVHLDRQLIEKCGMVLSVTDQTVPDFHLGELKEKYKGQLVGRYIESFEDEDLDEVSELALEIGLEALLMSRGDFRSAEMPGDTRA